MIEINTDKGNLVLSPGAALQIRLINPAFSKEIGDNSHSFALNVPSAPNQQVLGFYDSPITHKADSSLEAGIKIDSIEFRRGTLQIERGSGANKTYAVKLDIDNSAYTQTINETLLKDIDLGGVRDISGSGAGASISLNIANTTPGGFIVLVINDLRAGFYWNIGASTESILDYFVNQINNNNNLSLSTAVRNGTSLDITADPGQPLNYDLNDPGNEQSWTLASQTGAGLSTHQSIIAHMNAVATAANIADYDYCFFPVLNRNFYGGLNPDYLEYVNLWDWDANTFLENTSAAGERWRNTAIPFPRLGYLTAQICSHLGLRDISSFTQDADFNTVCFWNNYSLDFVRSNGGQDFNGFANYIDLKNHVPEDMTIKDIFEYIRINFNVSIVINAKNKTIDFKRLSEVPKETAVDFTAQSSQRYTIERKKGYEQGFLIKQTEDKEDTYFTAFSAQLQPYQTGAGNTVFQINFPPMPSILQPHPLGALGQDWDIPTIHQAGKTPYTDTDGNQVEAQDYIFRAILYKGLYPGINTAKTYPYGTCRNLDFYGNNIGPWSLCSTLVTGLSDNGIWEEFYFPFQGGNEEEPEIDTFLLLDLADLLQLDYNKKYRLRSEDGDFYGVIKQLDIKVTMQHIELTQAKFLRI